MTAPQTKRQGWLKCKLDKGMFSDEIVVSYPAQGQATYSNFVPIRDVEGRAGELGKVRVTVLREPGRLMAVLPTDYRDILFVTESDVADLP